MAELAGLAIAILALSKDCVELLSYISVAQSLGRDYCILNTKIDLERAYLLRWATRLKLATPHYDRRLDDPLIGDPIISTLTAIQNLFQDASILKERYGLQEVQHYMESSTPSSDLSISAKRGFSFREQFERLSLVTREEVAKRSTFKKIRWAVHDKAKFEVLITDLSYFATRVNDLVPEKPEILWGMIDEDFKRIQNVEQSRSLLDAVADQQGFIRNSANSTHVRNCQKRIMNQLWFRSMDSRRDTVSRPHQDTFHWPLDPLSKSREWSDLPNWLQAGSGIYWISGKAAAGKSTLMKHILYHERTKQYLQSWAMGDRLTVASFFFYFLGTEDQKSHLGLLKALLYNILVADPRLVSQLLPNMWREAYDKGSDILEPASWSELKHAFEVFPTMTVERKFCFFIDGLDEYEGPCKDVVDFLRSLTAVANVKVLVSSRPIAACHEAFHRGPILRLEVLNHPDIEAYAQSTVGEDENFKRLTSTRPEEGQMIISSLINKSEGVFLWVVLACRSVLAGSIDGDYLHELSQRVDELPDELEDLFSHIILRIESRYRNQAVKLLQIAHRHQRCYSSVNKLSALGLSITVEHNFNLSRIERLEYLSLEQMRGKCEQLEKRLRSRCRGLLEVSYISPWDPPSQQDYIHASVRFMHRTVFDFLDSTNSWIPGESPTSREAFDPLPVVVLQSLISKSVQVRGPAEDSLTWTALLLPLTEALACSRGLVALVLRRLGELAILYDNIELVIESNDSRYRTFYEYLSACSVYPSHDKEIVTALVWLSQLGIGSLFNVLWQEYNELYRRGLSKTRHSMLYYAINRGAIDMPHHWVYQPYSPDICQTLLSAGYDPNEHLSSLLTEVTPWTWWLDHCAGLMKPIPTGTQDRACKLLEITTLFIEAGADMDQVELHLKRPWSVFTQAFEDYMHLARWESKEDFYDAKEKLLKAISESESKLLKRRRSNSQSSKSQHDESMDERDDLDNGLACNISGSQTVAHPSGSKRRRLLENGQS